MFVQFNKVVLHNFLSFGDSQIDLRDKGYCLIEGRNRNPSDRSLSNGSGKSTIVSAISWCLTGQTIQGLKSNIENINTIGGTFVKLYFNVDNDEYIIERYKNHDKYKTDLKIYKNEEDVSGKGIRESENLLAQYLPDINFNLISSIILLGQGLPNSFTKNTPSGRKELLELLTKSDFMFQDVKDRITKRLDSLNISMREVEDKLLRDNTSNNIYVSQLEKKRIELENYNIKKDYDNLQLDLQDKINNIEKEKKEITILLSKFNEETSQLQEELRNKEREYFLKKEELNNRFDKQLFDLSSRIISLENTLDSTKKEIIRLENIKDICPTCGQKIPNIVKPDTSELKTRKDTLNEELTLIKIEKDKVAANKINEVANMTSHFNEETDKNRLALDSRKIRLNELNNTITLYQNKYNELTLQLSSLVQERATFENNKRKIEEDISTLENKIINISSDILYNTNEKERLISHLDILSKMNSLVKRDFRGYLLRNIINYIERKSKEYCLFIFNSDNLSIQLDGNDIDIVFCNKTFENLSGGEKQKIDVIIQFAIRDMMSKYLDFKTNILFLDEITDNLDSKGCDGLINLISNTLNDLESIFIISHHSDELSLPIDNTIVVEKDSNGISRII